MTKIRILTEILVNEEGSVRSTHRPFDTSDAKEMQSLPSGGLNQVAHAMFVEALRRETYTMAIMLLSTDVKLENMTKEDLDEHVRAHVMEMCSKLGLGAAEEVLQMIKSQKN